MHQNEFLLINKGNWRKYREQVQVAIPDYPSYQIWKDLVKQFLLLLAIILSHNFCFAVTAVNRPNILFIMADDHTREGISSYGSWLKDDCNTPNIDRIANEGMRFNNTFCNNSICSPSRASILTGQHSHTNGVTKLGGRLRSGVPLFSKELQKNGYTTALVGKWHIRNEPEGFDYHVRVIGQGTYFNPKLIGTETLTPKGYSADVFTDIAIKWLDETRDKKKPFALCLHYKAVHSAFEYPERYRNLYADVEIAEPSSLYVNLDICGQPLKQAYPWWLVSGKFDSPDALYQRYINKEHQRGNDELGSLDPLDVVGLSRKEMTHLSYQHFIKRYICCVRALDENVGRVLDYLDEQGLAENTIVIYTGDQGYWLGQNGFFDKRLMYDTSMAMPLLVRFPGVVAAKTQSDALCMNIDFAETMLEAAGVEIPEAMQGRSLMPLLKREHSTDWRKEVFYAYWEKPPHYGIRTERYKLIYIPQAKAWELLDLKKDPDEMRNLIDDPNYNSIVTDMKSRLKKLIVEIGLDPKYLPPNDPFSH